MYNNLKTRSKTIDGQEYELPPLVSWNQAHERFRVQVWNGNGQTEVNFSVKAHGSVAAALEAAKVKAKEVREEGLKKAPYKVLGIDENGKPLRLGEGIYLHSNTLKRKDGSLRIYQLLMVIYGTRTRGNLKRQTIPLGRAGHFTQRRFNNQLQKAKELRDGWVTADASPPALDLTTIWSTRGANLDHRSEAA